MSHTVQQVYVHVVWATRMRAPLLTGTVRARAWECIRSSATAAGAVVVAVGGVADHVHLLVLLPATVALASVVKRAKGATSHLLNRIVTAEPFAWQEGYAAFSVDGERVAQLRAYIDCQEAHHAGQTLRAEWEVLDV